jgi:hypothetical protein
VINVLLSPLQIVYEGVSQGAVSFLVRALTDKKTRSRTPPARCKPILFCTLLPTVPQNRACSTRCIFEIRGVFKWGQQHILEVQVRRAHRHPLPPYSIPLVEPRNLYPSTIFRNVGVVTVTGDGGDTLLEAALDAGAEDVAPAPEDGAWEVRLCVRCFFRSPFVT